MLKVLSPYCPTTFGVPVKLLEGYGWRKLHGCNMTTDKLYTSVELAEWLLAKKLTMTMNRKGLTKGMKALIGRVENTTIVLHETILGNLL